MANSRAEGRLHISGKLDMVDEEGAQRVLVRKGLLSNQELLKEITIERSQNFC
jgi:hypothetical protein